MKLLEFANIIAAIFSSLCTLEEARTSPKYFTRRRKMPFDKLLQYLLCGCKGAAQAVLNEFFQRTGDTIHMTQQALSKARSHFDHSPFMMRQFTRSTIWNVTVFFRDGMAIRLLR